MAHYTILLVDYEPRSVERLRGALIQAGYGVEVAKDGIAGGRRFVEMRPDLALIEAMIPKKNGFELCLELKRTPHGQTTPILIITGVYKGRKYRSQAMHEYKCDAYLEKPIEPEQLVEVVRRHLEQFRPDGPRPGTPEVRPAATRPTPPDEDADVAEIEILDRLDEILPDARGKPGSRPPRATVHDLESARRDPRGNPTAPPVQASRGGALPAIAPPAPDIESPGSLPVDASPSLPRPAMATRGRIWLWLAFAALVIFGGAMILLLR